MSSAQEQVLVWASGCSRSERFEYLNALLDCFSNDEIGKIKGIVSRKKRQNNKKQADGPAVDSSCDGSQEAVGSGPEACLPVASSPIANTPWWAKWSPEETLSVDCEFVSLQDKTGMDRQKCGTVDIVNGNMELVYSAKVYHKYDSFLVNSYTRGINGFGKGSFDNKSFLSLEKLKEEVEKVLAKILCVGVALEGDFRAMGLAIGDFDAFDLQWKYKNKYVNEYGAEITEPMSLKAIYKECFRREIHKKGEIHTSNQDAKYTMEIFNYYKTLKQ